MLRADLFYLLSIFISNVITSDLVFENCESNGWTCLNNAKNEIDITYSCQQELQKSHPEILWKFGGLPSLVKSVTIKDCDAVVSIGVSTLDVATKKFPHLCGLVVKNVTEVQINEGTFSILDMFNDASLVKFENIKHINSLKKNTIGGNNLDSLKSVTFEMNDVQINTIEERAVWWTEDQIPFKMFWNNVKVNVFEGDAIHITDTKKNPKSQVFIQNSKFGQLKKKSLNVHSSNFDFTNNEVDLVEKSAFKIQSNKTIFSKNNFHHIANYAFLFVNIGSEENSLKFQSNTIHESEKLSMNFGAPYYNELEGKVYFHENKFNCLNSTWLQRSDEEKIKNTGDEEEEEVQYVKYLKKVEKVILDNNDNVCISLPCSINLSKFKDMYKKNGLDAKYC